jgi:hypothetical protein
MLANIHSHIHSHHAHSRTHLKMGKIRIFRHMKICDDFSAGPTQIVRTRPALSIYVPELFWSLICDVAERIPLPKGHRSAAIVKLDTSNVASQKPNSKLGDLPSSSPRSPPYVTRGRYCFHSIGLCFFITRGSLKKRGCSVS